MRFLIFYAFVFFINVSAFGACSDPDGTPGELMYNGTYDVFQGCTARGWMAFHLAVEPQCPNVGDVCPLDGTIYAGKTPDGNTRMFMAAQDAPTPLQWGPDSAIPGMGDCINNAPSDPSCFTGTHNADLIVHHGNNYAAAHYCDALDAHGHTDWYLPSLLELSIVNNLHPVGGLQTGQYWTSSKPSIAGRAYRVWIPYNNSAPPNAVTNNNLVRCVRKE